VKITHSDIEKFLSDFKQKMKIWDIVFRNDRQKNTQALIDLEITPAQRRAVIEKLIAEDYSEGPLPDTLNRLSPMWVFGRQVKQQEVYIKITMGNENCPVICISFHRAEHPMKYPLKK
jgi:hypothetical protein